MAKVQSPPPDRQKWKLIVNERGQLPLPKAFLVRVGVRAGDEYFVWKARAGIRIVFPRLTANRQRKIPKYAQRGRIGRWNNSRELLIQAAATSC